jgi:hypothetical protein
MHKGPFPPHLHRQLFFFYILDDSQPDWGEMTHGFLIAQSFELLIDILKE